MNYLRDETARVWVCEKGHIDDHHGSATPERCSRCGGLTTDYSLAQLVQEFYRLRMGFA